MKLFRPASSARRSAAYTLVEMMFSAVIYLSLFIGTLITIQIFALRIYTLAATKLTATSGCRKALNQIRDDIRQGKEIQVGSADNNGNNFTAYSGTTLAIGDALQVFSTTNLTAPFSLYYMQTNSPGGVSSNNLIWISVTTNSVTNTEILACYITNMNIFAAEDWQDGWPTNCNVAGWTPPYTTNSIYNNQIYSVLLQFYQWEYPIAMVSASNAANAYDYYQLRTRICRRAND